MPKPSLAIISGQALADYHFGDQHPFGPFRLQAFLDGLKHQNLTAQLEWLEPVSCHLQSLLSFHSIEYLEKLKYMSEFGEGFLDHGDTPARKGIYEAGSAIVGSVLNMLDQIMAGHHRRGFVPIAGLHHGYPNHCSGFCIFNDCAIAIEHLRKKHQLQKILYVDIDAHHGDGVFYSYESDCNLYIVDFHEDGKSLYPGTGDADETGTGAATGHKMNIPLPQQAGDDLFAHHWAEAEAFMHTIQPEFIIFQCGADSMKGDPITHLELTQKSYRLAALSLTKIADRYCAGRMIGLGGGGYNLKNISIAWPTVIRAML
jgi:acetoin utilization protein AcuC